MFNVQKRGAPMRFFAIHFYLLRFLGLGWWHHPDENDSRNFPGWYLYYAVVIQLVWVAGFVGLESIDPFIGEKDLDRFMFSLSFVITHDLTLIKLYIFLFKNNDIQDVVHTLNIKLQGFYQNSDKNGRTIRITKILTASFVFFGWITIGNTNVYGIIQDLRWKAEVATLNESMAKPSRTLPQPIFIPWKYESDESYISTFLLETIGLLWTGHIVMTIDTFIGSVILHMSSQFTILQEALTTAYDRTFAHLAANINSNVNTLTLEDLDNSDPARHNERLAKLYYTDKYIETALENTFMNCIHQYQVLIKYVYILLYSNF